MLCASRPHRDFHSVCKHSTQLLVRVSSAHVKAHALPCSAEASLNSVRLHTEMPSGPDGSLGLCRGSLARPLFLNYVNTCCCYVILSVRCGSQRRSSKILNFFFCPLVSRIEFVYARRVHPYLYSPISLANISSINLVSIFRCSSSATNRGHPRCVDSSTLVCSLSSHRHSYIGFVFNSH